MKNKILKALMIFILGAGISEAAIGEEIIEKKLSNGIPVYYVQNTTNKIDSIYVGVKGGTKYYTPELSGIENATFLMMGKGSANYTYEKLQEIKYRTSATVSVSSSFYGSWMALNSIDEYLDETLPMFLDGFKFPTFKNDQYEKIMNDYAGSVQQVLNDPLSLSLYYAKKMIYENHPYETSSGVTPESIGNITLDAIRNYYLSLMDSRRFYIIAITRAPLENLMPCFEEKLGFLTEGTDPLKDTQEIPQISLKKDAMVFEHPSISGSSHIFRTVKMPANLSDEYIAMMIGQTVYSQIMHNVIRAKYGVCYTAEAFSENNIENIGYELLYRCSDFSNVKAQIAEARKIMSEGKYIVSTKTDGSFVLADLKDGFEGFRNSVINSLYSVDKSTSARAGVINSSLLMFEDTQSISKQRAKLNDVTCDEVIAVFNKYFNSDEEFWFGVCGPEDEESLNMILNN